MPVASSGYRDALSSGVLLIAQADVTKHAKEMPIARRIGIASYPSRWVFLAASKEIALSHANNIG
jgi:hypothetical protein